MLRTTGWRAFVIVFVAGCPWANRSAETNESRIIWDKTVNLRGTFGYKDNVLLSSMQPEGSAFWQTSADFFLFRLGDTRTDFNLFVSAEDRRYFSSDEVDSEQLLLTHVELNRAFLENWRAGAELQYYYLDQVIDASTTEAVLRSLQVQSHSLIATPYIRRALPGDTLLELRFEVVRQYFNRPLDDYWEIGPEIIFTKKYGHRSEATLSYAFQDRSYDTRRFVDYDFTTIPDTSLRYQQHEVEAGINHSWDEARRWRSRLRLNFEANRDNGTGFFDYDRYRISKRFSYIGEGWGAAIEGKWLTYNYLNQPVLSGRTDVRERTEYLLTLRVEKKLTERLMLFAESEHEWSVSNLAFDEYEVNTVMSGVDWEF